MSEQHEARAREAAPILRFLDEGFRNIELQPLNGHDLVDIASALEAYADERTAALTAEVERLREALEPFAEALGWENPLGSGDAVHLRHGPRTAYLTGADVLRARAALNGDAA